MTLASALAQWGLGLTHDEIPEPVRAAARRHLLDGLGCALGAVRTAAAPAMHTWANLATAPEQATVIGLAERRPAHVAAGANGYLTHALDFDDTHAGGLVHATSVVLPTAMAVAEEQGASGRDLLVAAVVGYEVICRLAAAAPHAFHRRGLHATSVCGVFAAALVAARLRGLDQDATVSALGIAGSMASGSLEFLASGTATKAIHPGLAASNGIVAATLAAGGVQGPASIFEGDAGLYRVMADRSISPTSVTDGLGESWETSAMTIKPYPACQLVHAAVDAVRGLQLQPGDVAGISVRLPEESVPIVAEPADIKRRPRTEYEAKFSLQWNVATAIVDGDVRLDAFGSDQRGRGDVLALADRVTYQPFQPATAAADAPGDLRVELVDGSTVEAHVDGSRGTRANPITDADVHAKLLANVGGERAGIADALARTIGDLSELDDLTPLTSLLTSL